MRESYEGYVSFFRYNGRWTASVLDDPPAHDSMQRWYPISIRIPAKELDRLGIESVQATASVDGAPVNDA